MATQTAKVCSTCGSENVFRDATVRWDREKGEWVLRQVHGPEFHGCEDWCEDCDTETTLVDKEMEVYEVNE